MISKAQAPTIGWSQIIYHQCCALLRNGGIINFVARPTFLLVWALCCYSLLSSAAHEASLSVAMDTYGFHSTGTLWIWLLALLNLYFALGLYRRYSLLTDTATSTVNSSAQGYAALAGTAWLPDGEYARGLPQLPVTLWLPFYLADEDGRCLLYPEMAEIVIQPADHHFHWLQTIYPGQELYVLGDMRTYTGDNTQYGYRQRVSELLTRWKSRPLHLLNAFDKNGDGKICAEEWASVVQSAQSLAREDDVEQRQQPGTHIIDSSAGGRLFMITNIPPEQLALRYRIASWLHTAAWLGLLMYQCS